MVGSGEAREPAGVGEGLFVIYLLGYPRSLSYDLDWIQAFVDRYGDTRLVHLGQPQNTTMQDAELVVLLHSATAQGVRIPPWVYQCRPKCPVLMLTGNDYKHFDDKREAARRLQVDVLGTLAPNTPFEAGNGIGHVEHIPHALNPKAFQPSRRYQDRPITIGFRGFRYPETLGDDQRNRVVEAFIQDKGADVAFKTFPHPAQYADWLTHCKATVATEAGMPGMKAVSSRHFDSIGAGAALVMPRGDYSGCLDERHYIALEDDLSNKAECLDRVRDEAQCADVANEAYRHVMSYHTYAHRMARLDELLWR